MSNNQKNRQVSAFRELREAAGASLAAVAEAAGIHLATAYTWDHGEGRPRWRQMPALAKILGIDVSEAVKLTWKEAFGDPCTCGCGGKKVAPNYGEAKHLYVQVTCQCGKTRTHATNYQHARLCRRCSYDSRSLGPPVKLTCVGYEIYGVTKHATNCPRKTEKQRKT